MYEGIPMVFLSNLFNSRSTFLLYYFYVFMIHRGEVCHKSLLAMHWINHKRLNPQAYTSNDSDPEYFDNIN